MTKDKRALAWNDKNMNKWIKTKVRIVIKGNNKDKGTKVKNKCKYSKR